MRLGAFFAGALHLFLPVLAAAAPAAGLSFEDRVACQALVEEVYWRHREWPGESRGTKPLFEDVVSRQEIAAKVDDALRRSRALGIYWHRTVTPEQLQAEIDRMARHTRRPEMLRELWAALGDDPHRVAECLARPRLAERMAVAAYAFDPRWHGGLRRRAQGQLAEGLDGAREGGADVVEEEWVRDEGGFVDAPRTHGSRRLDAKEWGERLRVLAGSFPPVTPALEAGGSPDAGLEATLRALPLDRPSPLREDEHGFESVVVLEKSPSRIRVATARWHKRPFAEWWQEVRGQLEPRPIAATSAYTLPPLPASGCTDDTWMPTSPTPDAPPGPRQRHTAVWTGTEMIVWGGEDGGGALATGGRYDPLTDTWQPTTSVNAPVRRTRATAVWTGTEMIVWGGWDGSSNRYDGAAYNPGTDTWRALPSTGAPSGRADHTAVWTGTEMIVWGGSAGATLYGSGGRYDPATNTWRSMTSTGAPGSRDSHTAVWTGAEMIVWGGWGGEGSGGRYNPAKDAWTAVDTMSAPLTGWGHTAVWTGTQMIVWGGDDPFTRWPVQTGGRYDPAQNVWTSITVTNAPAARRYHSGIWTGAHMVVWGGDPGTGLGLGNGGRYDPSTNTWAPTSAAGAPAPRQYHSAVWSGFEMIVWGGKGASYESSGGRYGPSGNSWAPTSSSTPAGTIGHTATWTGAEMIVWGGLKGGREQSGGDRYDPATDVWTRVSAVNAPAGRADHTAVWTGSEMIVWGGTRDFASLNTGGRYDPVTDRWAPTTLTGAPRWRDAHTAVWTGTEMIVWGGRDDDFLPTDGGRYDPATDHWVPTTLANAPNARHSHTAVWTGAEMVVWGGTGTAVSTSRNDGGRYDPARDRWVPTTLTNAPRARYLHTAAWTGTEMIVWGGTSGQSSLRDGGRYNPATGLWVPTTVSNAPSARYSHTAAWTGEKMIVWGGNGDGSYLASGSRYDPGTDAWAATSTLGAPSARYDHTAVWAGEKMIVWGGSGSYPGPSRAGALYCAPLVPRADLSITLAEASDPVAPGAAAVYTISITNDGPTSADGVTVSNPTPPGLVFVSNTGDCTTAFPCGLGTVGVGQSRTITATFQLPVDYAGPNPITDTASVASTTTDPDPANNETSVQTAVGAASADLAVGKLGPASVLRGEDVVYSITVTNAGPSDAFDVQVADPTPAGLTFVANAGDCTAAFPCSLGWIPTGQSRVVTATYRVPSGYAGPTIIVNTATVDAQTADPVPANNSDDVHTSLEDPGALGFYTVEPCRVVDTRSNGGAIAAGETRTVVVAGSCHIPPTARAVSLNLTVTQPSAQGNIRLFPAGAAVPTTSSINYRPGETRANNAVVALSASGGLSALCSQASGSSHMILDVNGYFE